MTRPTAPGRRAGGRRDRKSTRLNSSHGYISYAVFCLIKNNGLHPLEALMRERVVVLDGAMGTMVQQCRLTEAEYRGDRFKDWKGKDLKVCLEILLLTRPEVIGDIHRRYLEAGADIIETNTFSGTSIGLHDFLFRGEPTGKRKDIEFFQRVVDDAELSTLVSEINLQA